MDVCAAAQVKTIAGDDLLRGYRPSAYVTAFKDAAPVARLGQVSCADKCIVAGAYENDVEVRHLQRSIPIESSRLNCRDSCAVAASTELSSFPLAE